MCSKYIVFSSFQRFWDNKRYSLMLLCIIYVSCFIPVTLSCCSKNASISYNWRFQKFTFHDYVVDNAVASANFENEILTTGWSYLEVHTNEDYPDPIQAYAAGLVEGYLTADLVNKHWYNTLSDYCDGEEIYCKRLAAFLQENLNFMNENIKLKRSHDVYWHQVALTLEQLKGLEDGLRNTTGKPSTDINVMGLLLINIMGDLIDLEDVLERKQRKPVGSGSCSALVKFLPNKRDLLFAHDTWTNYNTMLRILKKYSLKFHITVNEGAPLIPGHTCTFSSSPGRIFSADDFYLISSGLATMETTISNDNSSLWQYVTAKGTILEWQRNIIANRLAKTGEQWTKIFKVMNSGTYNNQWMVLDYKLFKPGKPLQNGLLWIIEQMPGYVHSSDVTETLRKQSYWPSYNKAYFEDVFNMSGGQANVEKYGDWFSYDKTPRARIFQRDHTKVKDMSSMIKLMRYNDFINDPLSRCNCTPPYSADNAISSRCDLNPINGTYPIPAMGHFSLGGTDMKLTNYELFQKYEFVAISGPTYDPLPPFQWSKSDFDKTVKHEGHPDLWKFKPIIHKWLL